MSEQIPKAITFEDVKTATRLLEKLNTNQISKETYLRLQDQELDLRISGWGYNFWNALIKACKGEYAP